jgi:hypothetical protein
VNGINQIVFAVDFIDVNVVRVIPIGWPWIVIDEVIATIIKAAIFSASDAKGVLATEV